MLAWQEGPDTHLGQPASGYYADIILEPLRGCWQARPCSEAPRTHWACLPVDVIGHVIVHMHHTTLEALSEVNAHWRAAVKVRTGPVKPVHIFDLLRTVYTAYRPCLSARMS